MAYPLIYFQGMVNMPRAFFCHCFDTGSFWLLFSPSLSKHGKRVRKRILFLSIGVGYLPPLPIQKVTDCSRHPNPTKGFTWWGWGLCHLHAKGIERYPFSSFSPNHISVFIMGWSIYKDSCFLTI